MNVTVCMLVPPAYSESTACIVMRYRLPGSRSFSEMLWPDNSTIAGGGSVVSVPVWPPGW